MTASVYGPDGLLLSTLYGATRSELAEAARAAGGVQAYVLDGDARECWCTDRVGGAWKRAWRREGPALTRQGAQEGAAAVGRGCDGLGHMEAPASAEGAG